MRQSQRVNKPVPTSVPSKRPSARPSTDRGILLAATELFAERTRHDVEEEKIFLELARNLLPSTVSEDRRRIANLLASHPEMPDDLLELLASDEDELTAYPALRYSPRLSVDLLLQVAEKGPDSLRKAIANRPSLRESVIDALCEHAGAHVIRILLDRDDVTLTQAHQTKLSCRSDIVATLGLELAGQDALNPEGLMGQYLHLPAPLKAKAIAAAEMTSLLKRAQTPGGAAEHRPDSARRRLQKALVEEAVAQNRTRFADLLGQGLGLPQSTCDHLLQADQCDGLTIALKALGMSTAQTTTVLIRLFGENMPLTNLRGLLRLYGTLSSGAAEVIIGQWMLYDQALQKSARQHAPQFQDHGRREDAAGMAAEDRSTRQNKSHGHAAG